MYAADNIMVWGFEIGEMSKIRIIKTIMLKVIEVTYCDL